MKKFFVCIILLIVLSVSFIACSNVSVIKLDNLELQYQFDDTIPVASGTQSSNSLGNIDRGFRLETYYTLGSGRAWPTDEKSNGYDMLNAEIEYYSNDSAVEIQVYIYLNEYNKKPLDSLAFSQLKAYFEYIRFKRMSMLLRFAYDHTQGYWISPTQEVMLGHIWQLKGFMQDNAELINDTVTAYQFGVIGAWGEWGATGEKYDEQKILDALVDMMPYGTYFQGRYMRVTNQLKNNEKFNMVGYHNDFLVARPHPWNTAGDKHNSKDYKNFRKTNMLRINDGEMPWGDATQEPNEIVNGKKFIIQAMEHSLSTLSIKHNYTEGGKEHNIARWKNEFISQEEIEAMNCPYYPQYFKNSNGDKIKRSVYDYLRDFLGYNLLLSNLKISDTGKTIDFMLTNFGMGTPLTLDGMILVVKTKGEIKEIHLGDFITTQLTTYGQIKFSVSLNESITDSSLGIKIFRNNSKGDYTVKTANDIPYENGINWIK